MTEPDQAEHIFGFIAGNRSVDFTNTLSSRKTAPARIPDRLSRPGGLGAAGGGADRRRQPPPCARAGGRPPGGR